MSDTVTSQMPNSKLKGYFKKEKIVLKAFGISFTGNESTTYKLYSFLGIVFINFLFTVLDVREVFINEFDVVADMVMYVFGAIIAFFKTSVIMLNRVRLGKMLDKLEQKPFIPNTERGGDEEQKLIGLCLRITSAQSFLYWGCATACLLFGAAITLIKRIKSSDSRNWELSYGPLNVVNTTYSPNYEISWFYQNISLIWIGFHFCTIDLITANVLAHISFQFKILQNNFKRIVENSYNKMIKNEKQPIHLSNNIDVGGSVIPWKYLNQSVKQAVEYHLAIVGIAEEMEGVFSSLLLLVFLGTLGMLCFDVYHASLMSMDDVRLLRSSVEVVAGCLQVITICYWGNEVMLQSQQLGQAVYESNFVGTDLKFQGALILIIRRSLNPTKITAGKFSNVCLFTFTWILKTSYSAFMVLHNRKTNEIDQ